MIVKFLPSNSTIEANEGTKILVAARKAKQKIIFGCASCRCGTCAIRVISGSLSPMSGDEIKLLKQMNLPADGEIRLSCQARIEDSNVDIDLDFQNQYSPEVGLKK